MLVVTLADFSKDVSTYISTAAEKGLTVEKDGKPYVKILPEKQRQNKTIQKKLESLRNVIGIFPSNIDENEIANERASAK